MKATSNESISLKGGLQICQEHKPVVWDPEVWAWLLGQQTGRLRSRYVSMTTVAVCRVWSAHKTPGVWGCPALGSSVGYKGPQGDRTASNPQNSVTESSCAWSASNHHKFPILNLIKWELERIKLSCELRNPEK